MDFEIFLPPNAQFLFRVLLQNRLNTKDLMAEKNFYMEFKYYVYLCDEQVEETMSHLFFSCDFSQTLWWKILEEWNLDLDFTKVITKAKTRSLNIFLKR
jgi:hypothetical protein